MKHSVKILLVLGAILAAISSGCSQETASYNAERDLEHKIGQADQVAVRYEQHISDMDYAGGSEW